MRLALLLVLAALVLPSPALAQDPVARGADIYIRKGCLGCHGASGRGGVGPQLARTPLTLDAFLNQLRNPRGNMPPFNLSDTDLMAMVAFIHDQKTQAESAVGGRRSVDVSDLQTGNATAGKKYFDTACTRCHSATGDLAGIAARVQGLQLLQRMLYPGGPPRDPKRAAQVTVTLANGQTVTGRLTYRDEFTIGLTDASGWYRSWPTRQVRFTVDDPLQAHVDQLGKYTDADMHDVLAYLQTLR